MSITHSYKVGSPISEYKGILYKLWNNHPEKCQLIDSHFARYDIDENTLLVFNIIEGKLAKFSYLNNYPYEVYSGIKIGMTIKEISKKYNLIYEDNQNYFYIENERHLALSFESPYDEAVEANPGNRLEEATFFEPSLLRYN